MMPQPEFMIKQQAVYRKEIFMERHGFANEKKKGQMNAYRKKLGEIWPELTGFLDEMRSVISVSGMRRI